MNKLDKDSEIYLVVRDNTIVIHYDCNRRCYNIKDVIITTDGDLHTLMSVKTDSFKDKIENIIIDSLLVNYKFTSCLNLFSGFVNLERIIGLEYLNTSWVNNMCYMFFDCRSLTSLNLKGFNTSRVTYMEGMFFGCSSLTELYVGNFNTSNVKDMSWLFRCCKSLTNLNIRNFNTTKTILMHGMFDGCRSLTDLDLRSFDTSNVKNMCYMFEDCEKLEELDLSNFDTSKVVNMKSMFYNCKELKTIYVGKGWNTNEIGESTDMFRNCINIVGGKGTRFNPLRNAVYPNARIDGGKSKPGYLTGK